MVRDGHCIRLLRTHFNDWTSPLTFLMRAVRISVSSLLIYALDDIFYENVS